jgi:hypothetical protein
MTMAQTPPHVQDTPLEISVYDPKLKEWRRGRLSDPFIPRDPINLTWTNTGYNSDVAPDADRTIDILYAERIAIQIDTIHPSNTSTDFDVNVETSIDGANWDTIPYAQDNLGDQESKTFLVTPGPAKMRLRGDNNDDDTTGYAHARIQIIN